jgi:hypothetical protein
MLLLDLLKTVHGEAAAVRGRSLHQWKFDRDQITLILFDLICIVVCKNKKVSKSKVVPLLN